MTTPEEVVALVRDVHGIELAIEGRAAQGESGDGAWFARLEGERVVLKWHHDEDAVHRYEHLGRALDIARGRGVPAPRYTWVGAVPGLTVVTQEVMPGRDGFPVTSTVVREVQEVVERLADIDAPRLAGQALGSLVVHSLVVGEDGWCVHETMLLYSARTRAVAEHARAVGADADPAWFAADDLVHLDLHPGNLLARDDGGVAAIIDWEGALCGDRWFDLAYFAFAVDASTGGADLTGDVWRSIEDALDERVLRAYVAHIALRMVEWQVRFHSRGDVLRWLEPAEALVARYQ